MRVLVAGGCGFIGTHVVRRLCALGHWVTVVDDLSGAAPFNITDVDSLPTVTRARTSVGKYAVTHDLSGFDCIINLAVRKMQACEDMADAFDVNAVQAATLAAYAAEAHVPRFVHVSTGSVLGWRLACEGVDECSCPAPESTYAVSKYAGERLVQGALRGTATTLTTLRLFNVMGPGQPWGGTGGVLANWCAALADLSGAMPYVTGDGFQKRHVTDVRDVADTIMRLAIGDMDTGYGLLHIASGQSVALIDLWNELCRVCPDAAILLRKRPPRPGDVAEVCCDNAASLHAGVRYAHDWRATVQAAWDFYSGLAHAPE